MEVRLTVIGSSPAWPNPGSAQSGYLVEGDGALLLDCGPGVLGRLRELELYPRSIAITHFHLDHWGDLVPWAWLNAYGPQEHRIDCALWLPPGGRGQLDEFASHWGNEAMFEEAFEMQEFEPGVPFTTAGFEVQAVPAPALRADRYGFRVTHNGTTLAYSGDSAPTERARRAGARRRPVPLRGDARRRRRRRPARAATSPPPRRSQPPTGGSC